ncbi:MAG: ABC transporter permease, partial [Candidatus Thorarchaeota archaeon]
MGIKIGFRRKRVVVFTALSIALSVSLLYTALAINSDLSSTTEQYIRSSTTPIDIAISSTRWDSPISEDMRNEMQLDYGINNVIPRIQETIQIDNGSEWLHMLLVGIDFESERHIGNLNIIAGNANISSTQCFLTNFARDQLSLEIGDRIEIETSAGIQWLNVSGYGNVVDKGVFGPVIFIPLETAWEIYDIRYPDLSTNTLFLEVTDVFEIPHIVDMLSNRYGETFIVSNQKSYSLWITKTFLDQTQLILITLTAAAFLVAVLRISTSFLSIFAATKYETGILRAMGSEKSNVFLTLLAQISVVGILGSVVGSIIGIVMGYFSTFLTTQILTLQNPGFAHLLLQSNYTIDIPLLLIACLIGLVLTIISGMFPAWLSSHDSIVDSLNRGGTKIIAKTENIGRHFIIIWKLVKLLIILFCCLVSVQVLTDVFHLGLINLDTVRILTLPAIFILIAIFSRRISQPFHIRNILSRGSSEVVRVISSKNMKRRASAGLLVFNLFVTISL